MPGPNRVNRAAQQRQEAAVARQTYFVIDPHCTEIHGLEITPEIRKNGLSLTETEALTFVAAGAVTTDKAVAEQVAKDLTAHHKAADKAAEQSAKDAEAAAIEQQKAAAQNTAGTESPVPPPAEPAKTTARKAS